MSMDNHDESLQTLWSAAEELRVSIETTGNALDPSYPSRLASALAQYATLSSRISSLSLFSLNESLDDVTTSSLPYMLCSFHQAGLVMRMPSLSPAQRKGVLAQARNHYESFLSLISSYNLLLSTPLVPGALSHAELYEAYLSDPTSFTATKTGPGSDATARRNAKMANFKAEKSLQAKIQFLQINPGYLARSDEEAIRSVYLAQIQKALHDVFQALDGLNQEIQVLALAPDPDARHVQQEERERERLDVRVRRRQQRPAVSDRHRDKEEDEENNYYSERLDAPLRDISITNKAPLLDRTGKPLRPFTLVSSRQDLARGVFRPGHNLPTMSIDEYLAEERRQGNIIEGGGETSYSRNELNEDDIEKVDEEMYKARAWDEFKEDNPKGAGNTMNRG